MHAPWRFAALPLRLTVVVILLASVGCNTRTPLLDRAVLTTAPTPWNAGPPNPPSTPTLIELAPGGTIGGGSGRGTVLFDFPAPEGGTPVSLTVSDSVVTVTPSAVLVAAGGLSVDFAYTTQPVAADRLVVIVATTAAGRSVSAALGVWAVLPTFFSYSSDRGEQIGRGAAGRFTPENARFTARCSGSVVSTIVVPSESSQPVWFVRVGAPRGAPLRPGAYENASGSETGNLIAVDFGPSCQTVGRFTVHEVDVRLDGQVLNFWVTFEQECAGHPGVLRGDLRLTNPPLNTTGGAPCVRE